jgi:hypothetical protein
MVLSIVNGFHSANSASTERRFAAEEWVMPEDEPSHGYRIALPRATSPKK